MTNQTEAPHSETDAEPPKSSRVFHLFLIPLAVVSLFVTVAVLFGYMGFIGQTPEGHVEQLRQPSRAAWQSAASLSQMLSDPRHPDLRRDAQLARDVADVLDQHLKNPAADERHVNLRVFLCRALGNFEVADGLPVLLSASGPEREPLELPVRLAALEAIAVLLDRQGPGAAEFPPRLLSTLTGAAGEFSANGPRRHDCELIRERAAYALGVLGGPAALEQLATMLDDPYPNVTFNAAAGLARHGDVRAVPVLVKMLDPDNPAIVAGEPAEGDARTLKQTTVMVNALRASRRLFATAPQVPVGPLVEAIRQLTKADVHPAVKLEARAVLGKAPGPLAVGVRL